MFAYFGGSFKVPFLNPNSEISEISEYPILAGFKAVYKALKIGHSIRHF